ncbi:hypothetical protein FA15DRAFT_362726 [Coprinopsis marcescibilis]|uniref:Uncharacterized protein n=1 Tax=Coprinopsis marcescibilis TaxID=230819 RepID=A0A5C3KB30_COPMA|nr:hypothetical protein FA15DRAFT_362726 [Coprinopsis marcescibilis]
MSLSQLSCPSFSMVMTSNGQEIVRLYDTYPARHRHVRFAITLKPEASTSGAMQPSNNEYLVSLLRQFRASSVADRKLAFLQRRIDTRFEGTMAYNVVYRYEHDNLDDAEEDQEEGENEFSSPEVVEPLAEVRKTSLRIGKFFWAAVQGLCRSVLGSRC